MWMKMWRVTRNVNENVKRERVAGNVNECTKKELPEVFFAKWMKVNKIKISGLKQKFIAYSL